MVTLFYNLDSISQETQIHIGDFPKFQSESRTDSVAVSGCVYLNRKLLPTILTRKIKNFILNRYFLDFYDSLIFL